MPILAPIRLIWLMLAAAAHALDTHGDASLGARCLKSAEGLNCNSNHHNSNQ